MAVNRALSPLDKSITVAFGKVAREIETAQASDRMEALQERMQRIATAAQELADAAGHQAELLDEGPTSPSWEGELREKVTRVVTAWQARETADHAAAPARGQRIKDLVDAIQRDLANYGKRPNAADCARIAHLIADHLHGNGAVDLPEFRS